MASETSPARAETETFLAELIRILKQYIVPGMISINPKFEEAQRAVEQSDLPRRFPDLTHSLLGHPTMAEALLLAILSGNSEKIVIKVDGTISVA